MNSGLDEWQKYLAVALVGTERQTPTAPKGKDAAAEISRQLDWSRPESALLGLAGMVALHQSVGTRPSAQALPPIEPSETEQLPLCNDKISRYFEKALATHPMLVSEILELLVSVGQRVPAKLLPALLNFGQKRSSLQDAILPVVGHRGGWLAAQNPAWSYASVSPLGKLPRDISPSDAEEEKEILQQRWDEAERAERYVVFSQWRSVDPDGAREALAATWKTESSTDRRELLSRLGQDVSMVDEPFLEAALVDRAKGVREAAVELLVTMPASRLCQRMAECVSECVQFKTVNSRLTLEVSLPETYDSDWVRDGIARQPVEGLGEKAGWLQQLVAKAPLSLWPQNFEAMSQCLQGSEWREMLLTGWAMAACHQHQSPEAVDWAYALLHQLDVDSVTGERLLTGEILRSLVMCLAMPQREAYLRAYLKKPAKTNSQHDIDQQLADWLRLVAQVPQRWDYDFSRLALKQLIRLMKGGRRSGSLHCPPLTLVMTLHPGLASEAVRAITNLSYEQSPTPAWQRFLDDFLPALSLRWDICQAFVNSS